MKATIKDLFKPFQPSIAFSGDDSVCYEEASPLKDLQDYIFCYWRLKTRNPLDASFKYRVVSDGCIDILFEQAASNSIFVTGFSTKYLEYNLGESFDYVGIRFLPTGFPALFNLSARVLTNEFLALSQLLPELNESIMAAVSSSMDLEGVTSKFDVLFLDHLRKVAKPEIDNRLLNAMIAILQSGGQIPLNQLDVGVSDRQLRRLFEFYFGESPKTFGRIIRFQNILGAKPSTASLKYNKIFYDEGYYDQAHFIKEFKAFYGVTPNKAFGR